MKVFNVLIEDNGKFLPYDIMPYLKRTWDYFVKHSKELNSNEEDSYWKFPKTLKEIKEWVKRELQHQYWARCEYEIILSPWPSYTKNGQEIIRPDKCRKIDIYDQCLMNIDTIVRMFIEEIYIPYKYDRVE